MKRRFFLPVFLTCSTLLWFLLFQRSRYRFGNVQSKTLSQIFDPPSSPNSFNVTSTSPGISLDKGPSTRDPDTDDDPEALLLASDQPAVVAIVPVTSNSLTTFEQTFPLFLPLSGLLQEIILLCPDSLSPAVRTVLRNTLSEDDFAYVDVSITTWISGLEEGSALLYTARRLTADRLLIFDSDLQDLGNDVLEMLAGPLLTPLPVGPRGFNVTGDRFRCIEADDNPKPAAFLVPPFSISPSLVPPHDLDPTPVYDIWESLGRHISLAQYEGVGGIAVHRGSSVRSWCSSDEDIQEIKSDRTLDSWSTSFDKGVVMQELARSSPNEMAHRGTFVLIYASERQLYLLSNVICRLQHSGHEISLAAISAANKSAEFPSTRTVMLSHCNVEISDLSREVAALREWFSSLAWTPTAVITPALESTISDGLDRIVASQYGPNIALIRIPDSDLPYCDWMGSLTVEEWRNWSAPQLEISVITDDRPKSLARLLSSLSTGHFFGDRVSLRINVEQTAGPQTLRLIDHFHWPHGPVFVHRRVIHGGLLPAVVESWYPRSNDSYGLMLEDDVELSPLFYAWVKVGLLHYRYGMASDRSSRLFGISLYQQKNLELRPEGRHRFNARTTFASTSVPDPTTPYLSQIPCSWGAVYFPEHWREFHAYLALRLSGAHPSLPVGGIVAPGVRSNRWTRSWKRYFIELVFLRGYVMLYPNYADYRSLSTNHLEVGSHVREMSPQAYELKKKLYQLPLLRPPAAVATAAMTAATSDSAAEPDASSSFVAGVETGLMDLPGQKLPTWNGLPVVDLLGLVSSESALRARGLARRKELFRCDDDADESDLRSFLCLDVAVGA